MQEFLLFESKLMDLNQRVFSGEGKKGKR